MSIKELREKKARLEAEARAKLESITAFVMLKATASATLIPSTAAERMPPA